MFDFYIINMDSTKECLIFTAYTWTVLRKVLIFTGLTWTELRNV
jgi:hypothetical protein